MSPRKVNREGRQRRILRKAADLFAERGYDGVTMRQVAHALKCSTGALYHFFPSKEALFRGCVRQAAERGMARARVVVDRQHEPVQQIMALAQHYLSSDDEHERLVMLMVAAAQSQNRRIRTEIVSEVLDEEVAWLSGVLERGHNAQQLWAQHPLVAGRVFVGLINGMVLQSRATGRSLAGAELRDALTLIARAIERRE